MPAVPASDLCRAGECSPACLLAAEPDGCRCRCEGRFHGALAAVAVETDREPIPRCCPVTGCTFRPDGRFHFPRCVDEGRDLPECLVAYLRERFPA